ncbi:MAG: CSLREA domain-containing protein [Ahniella sp.]|nr:CSLREA domain-containing protein [Ahniella sp.]
MFKTTNWRAILAGLFCLTATSAIHAATFVVTSTSSISTAGGCDADCSLHDAIVAANATTTADIIEFNISGAGVKTITLDADGLPQITRPVTIDGYTQTGAAANSAATGSNAVLTVALTRTNPDPINDTLMSSLSFSGTATGSIVRGIAFLQLGVTNLAFITTDADNMVIDGNFFGTNAAGDADGGQAPSSAITVNAASNNTTIGGNTAAARNLFAGIEQGITLFGTNAIIRNNTFGLEDNGTTALALGDVAILASGDGHEIGGIGALEGNVFANIDSHAVQIATASTGNSILGNTFRNNTGLAINLQAAGDPGNGVTPNDVDDPDSGANGLQNFPVIEAASRNGTTTQITVRLNSTPSRSFRLEFFGSDSADPSGFGEGERFAATRDVTTGVTGDAGFSFGVTGNALPAGDFVAATATDLTTGETSEFSQAVVVADTFAVNSSDDVTDGVCNTTHCSLREAIVAANVAPGTNRIIFNIPGTGPHTIVLGVTGLPAITAPIDLNGLSQPGSLGNTTDGPGNLAVRQIVLSAPSLSSNTDLMVFAAGAQASTISGIAFKDINSAGGNLLSIQTTDITVLGCSFGLDATGNVDGGSNGLAALEVTGDSNNIGGTSASSRLQFGGTTLAMFISGQNNVVNNITVGLDSNGSPTVPITGSLSIVVNGPNNIFDSTPQSPNRIFGNVGKGIRIASDQTGNRIRTTLFQGNGGIAIDNLTGADPVSGITPNDANDADTGANGLQNHPVITLAERSPDGTGTIQGTLSTNPVNGTSYSVDVFHSASAGPSGNGQGSTLLGTVQVSVNSSGIGTFALNPVGLPVGGFVSATATRNTVPLDTSEFSPAVSLNNAALVVVNTNLSGAGSLSNAIVTANTQPGADRIHFNIAGIEPHRIDAGPDGLPPIVSEVFIDGTTQEGFANNNSTTGFNGVITIEVAATAMTAAEHVFQFAAGSDNSRIRGLSIFRSAGPGTANGIQVQSASGVDFDANIIGADATGNTGSGFGTALGYGSGADAGRVGGATLNLRNLFTNNSNDLIISGDDVVVQANSFGRRRNGTVSPVDAGVAIAVFGGNAEIGGLASRRNLVAGHEIGVLIQSGGSAEISRNVITDMSGLAIDLAPLGPNPNDEDDADAGPNDLQNHPVIISASTSGGVTQVTGRLNSVPSADFRIELFAAEENASGFAEATQLVGETSVTTDTNGDVSFSVTVNPALTLGTKVTASATATSSLPGITSELSPMESVTGPDQVVNNTNDANDGVCNGAHCSLREAMIAANANADATRIRFSITGAGPTFAITPQSALPVVTQPMILDGYSQTGAVPNSNVAPPNNAVIKIVLDGTAIAGLGTNPPMFEVQSSDVEIRGVSIVGLDDGSNGNEGISTPSNVNIATLNVRVRGNFIGLLPDGTTVDANRIGVSLDGEQTDTGNEIGGPLPEHQNIISGNGQHGITGTAAGLIIQNNLIGTARDGVTDRGNVGNGMQVGGAFGTLITGNVIAHNEKGVVVTNAGRGIEIDPNSIHANTVLGIDLGNNGATANDALDADTGANNLTNKPDLVITSSNGQNRTVSMTLAARPSTNYFVSYYAERSCPGDGLGPGELQLGTDAQHRCRWLGGGHQIAGIASRLCACHGNRHRSQHR